MNLRWIMHDSTSFTSEYKGYEIVLQPPFWWIKKDGVVIDCCYYHSEMATGELQAKVQAERALDKITINYPI